MENDHEAPRALPRTTRGGRKPKAPNGTGGGVSRVDTPRAVRRPKSEVGAGAAAVDVRTDLLAELDGIARQAGCELVHAEWKGGTLQILIDRTDRDGGVSHADCEEVSKRTSALLDVLDFGRARYVLEVSSPGLDRQLYRPADYRRFVGSKARVTYSAPGVRKRTVVARIEAFSEPAAEAESTSGQVILHDEASGERLTLRLDQIQVARLEIEL